MSLNTFVTHPSVRIKGTENNYNPIQCMDADCFNKSPHMHCPFCVISESFHDPVILKAHYRVKHVDKGLEFAGLKILRCCDHCDIVGAIKGEKKFRGAHWHCYRCRNGFNRRDEAMKHYKTHFRNPQTTFQIQITQEVNHSFGYSDGNQIVTSVENPNADDLQAVHSIHPVLTEAVMNTSSTNNSIIAANETVNSAETIMIIEEHLDGSPEELSSGAITFSAPSTQLQFTSLVEEKIRLEKQVEELQHQNGQLQIEKSQMEQNLQNEIENLKLQITMQAHAIQNYQKQEAELLNQLRVPLDAKLEELFATLQEQHQELLQQQLAQVRRKYLQQLDKVEDSFVNVTNETLLVEINDDGSIRTTPSVGQADTNGELDVHINSNDDNATCAVVPVSTLSESISKEIICISCSLDGNTISVPVSAEGLKENESGDSTTIKVEEDADELDVPAAKRLKTGS